MVRRCSFGLAVLAGWLLTRGQWRRWGALALSGIVLQVITATRDYTGGSLGTDAEGPVAAQSVHHDLERPSRRIPEPACQVRLLSRHEPWMTGRLVYPDVWWRLDLVGLRDPDLAEIEQALGTT